MLRVYNSVLFNINRLIGFRNILHRQDNKRGEDDGYFGKGTYQISDEILTLNFVDIPNPQIRIEKIGNSDSLIVQLQIKNNLDGHDVYGANVVLQNNSKASFMYGDQTTLRTTLKQRELLSIDFIGFQQQKQEFLSPGVYKMNVMMGPPTKHQFGSGETKKFKIIRKGNITTLRDIEDKRVKFTSRNCKC